MIAIPNVQTTNKDVNQLQSNLRQSLQPMLKNPLINGAIISATLQSGSNVIQHGLNRTPQGWLLTDVNGSVSVYRSAAFSSQTLTLTSSGSAGVSIYVF